MFGNKKIKYHFQHIGDDQFKAVETSTVTITQDTNKHYLFDVVAMAPYMIKAEDPVQAMVLLKEKHPQAIDDFLSRYQEVLKRDSELQQEEQERNIKAQQISAIVMSTTSLISDQVRIVDNKGIVSVTIIEGMNVFRDMANELTGVVGGKSNSYMNKLDQVKTEAINNLKEKALLNGANGLIGFSFDIESLGTGGSGQLMVTATATAIVTEPTMLSMT